ncbi:hypothetical protein XELAEV_18025621mg [Xenopus laevis]|uniref:Uncharacterized protein n=1 Tax=Xenopus laevis TaxID=8355 RepID=A0A974D2N7_XENLA|nr:hypothetical protein XELAEV_18025621mg [Xenopus laevis]
MYHNPQPPSFPQKLDATAKRFFLQICPLSAVCDIPKQLFIWEINPWCAEVHLPNGKQAGPELCKLNEQTSAFWCVCVRPA